MNEVEAAPASPPPAELTPEPEPEPEPAPVAAPLLHHQPGNNILLVEYY